MEVLGRSSQGITEPFLCRGDDGALYYAKGKAAGRKSLVAEWIASSLAEKFGLPVAPFAIGEVDEALVRLGAPGLADLGAGYVFLSRRVDSVLELTWPNVQEIPIGIRSDVLVFDYWVRNQDRMLTELGGNPNLLWNAGRKEVVVIDHNQAFDADFDCKTFFSSHAFAASWDSIFEDMIDRQRYEDRLGSALGQLDDICDKMPESWWWLGDDLRLNFSPDDARAILTECLPNFWSRR
ncbi:HipA family kinase [Trinickia fusca]|nr:HipA family kinase [Trinickia fusca]